MPQTASERTKKHRARKVGKGVCAYHGCRRKLKPGRVHCPAHVKLNHEQVRRHREAHVAARCPQGLCWKCGRPLCPDSARLCQMHLDYQRRYYPQRRR